MMNYVLTIVRHFIGVAIGWFTVTLTNIGVDIPADTVEGAQEELTALGTAAILAIYATVEKLLKPLWVRWFGESQPGETTANIR